MKKVLSDRLKNDILEATSRRLNMYKNDFCLELDSEIVIDMESKYIIALLELGIEGLEKYGVD